VALDGVGGAWVGMDEALKMGGRGFGWGGRGFGRGGRGFGRGGWGNGWGWAGPVLDLSAVVGQWMPGRCGLALSLVACVTGRSSFGF
jgi:hypothetical protein